MPKRYCETPIFHERFRRQHTSPLYILRKDVKNVLNFFKTDFFSSSTADNIVHVSEKRKITVDKKNVY